MSDASHPLAIRAADVQPRATRSNYPEPFLSRVAGRDKRPLGDLFGLETFGVNLTRLAPGSESALQHRHTKQDEFIFILEGAPTLVTDRGEVTLAPGMCAGFPAGGVAHHLINRSGADVVYLEIGDRGPGDSAHYPQDDLKSTADGAGGWSFVHKDGRPY